MAKKKGSELGKKEYEYKKIYITKGLNIALQKYCDKYGGIGTNTVSKLVNSLLEEWAREKLKTDPELFIDINFEDK